jgi:hypothetical protein
LFTASETDEALEEFLEVDSGDGLLPDPLFLRGGDANAYSYSFSDSLNIADPEGLRAGKLGPLVKFAKNLRCTKPEIHGPHHKFPWGKKHCHIQTTCYVKGKKKSGKSLRIPVPCCLVGR